MNANNTVTIKGRLTADPVLSQTRDGKFYCRYTLAVDRKRKNAAGEREADFISCIVWEKTAELVSKYFAKGKMMLCLGEIRTGSYKDRNHSDVTHYTTDVVVNDISFCDDKKDTGAGATTQTAAAAPAPTQASAPSAVSDDLSDFEEVLSDTDLPF